MTTHFRVESEGRIHGGVHVRVVDCCEHPFIPNFAGVGNGAEQIGGVLD